MYDYFAHCFFFSIKKVYFDNCCFYNRRCKSRFTLKLIKSNNFLLVN